MNELFDTIIVIFRVPFFLLHFWKYGGIGDERNDFQKRQIAILIYKSSTGE